LFWSVFVFFNLVLVTAIRGRPKP